VILIINLLDLKILRIVLQMVKLEYRMCEKLSLDKLRCHHYMCDDISVDKASERCYSECEEGVCIQGHPCYGYSQLYYMKDPFLYVTTPPMKCLFGVQKGYNATFSMNLQFTDLDTNPEMKEFFDFIQSTDATIMKYLGINETNYLSQIKYDKKGKYEPNLLVKLPFRYNRFDVDIYSDTLPYVNILGIPSFRMMQCDIYLDKIWPCDKNYCAKWKVRCIHML